MRTKLVVTASFAAVLLFAGCSSSDSSSDSSPSSTTATDSENSDSGSGDSASSGPESVDACALADPALLQALGVAGEGEALDRAGEDGPPDIAYDICSWNSPIENPDDPINIVTVQVVTEGPDAVINPLEMLLSALDSPTPVDVGTNGKIYEGGLIAGGGGIGRTIVFEAEGGKLITVSQTAEVVDVAALTALAQGVEANL
jgi:hypothetical protein